MYSKNVCQTQFTRKCSTIFSQNCDSALVRHKHSERVICMTQSRDKRDTSVKQGDQRDPSLIKVQLVGLVRHNHETGTSVVLFKCDIGVAVIQYYLYCILNDPTTSSIASLTAALIKFKTQLMRLWFLLDFSTCEHNLIEKFEQN